MTGYKYENRILRINLTTGEVKKELFDQEQLRLYIGGVGVALKILYDEVGPEVHPYDPENKLILQAGPFNGTKMPGSGIYQVAAKGPLTDFLINCQSNGYFGARMRHVGYETIILEGVAPELSVVKVTDDGVEIVPCPELAGVGVWETEERVKAMGKFRKNSVACIGPGGENLVDFACIFNDEGHAAATNGPGAVMGSKKVKAVLISTDTTTVNTYAEVAGEIRDNSLKAAAASGLGGMVMRGGTLAYFDNLPGRGGVPTKNYSTNVYDYDQFSVEERAKWWDKKNTTCFACPWAHTGTVTIKKGKAKGMVLEEPEFESLAGFSTNMGNDDFGEAVRMCAVNEAMGFDGKEASFLVSFVIDCYESGLLTKEDTCGLELKWGDTETVEQFLHDVAYQSTEFGRRCRHGLRQLAMDIGGEALLKPVHTGRGTAPNVVDERMSPMAYYNLTMSESGSFGGFSGPDPDVGNIDPLDPNDFRQIGWYLGGNASKWTLMDAYGSCFFYVAGVMAPIIDALNTITGWDFDKEELLDAGYRILALGRAYNVREGLTVARDTFVSNRLSLPYVDGPMKGKVYKLWDEVVWRAYYERCGWDVETGKPTAETLKRLKLDFVIDDMWPEESYLAIDTVPGAKLARVPQTAIDTDPIAAKIAEDNKKKLAEELAALGIETEDFVLVKLVGPVLNMLKLSNKLSTYHKAMGFTEGMTIGNIMDKLAEGSDEFAKLWADKDGEALKKCTLSVDGYEITGADRWNAPLKARAKLVITMPTV